MCDCRNIYTEKFREKTGDPEARLEEAFFYNKKENDFNVKLVIQATYRKKNKKGEFNKSQSKTGFVCLYCPFCGEKIN